MPGSDYKPIKSKNPLLSRIQKKYGKTIKSVYLKNFGSQTELNDLDRLVDSLPQLMSSSSREINNDEQINSIELMLRIYCFGSPELKQRVNNDILNGKFSLKTINAESTKGYLNQLIIEEYARVKEHFDDAKKGPFAGQKEGFAFSYLWTTKGIGIRLDELGSGAFGRTKNFTLLNDLGIAGLDVDDSKTSNSMAIKRIKPPDDKMIFVQELPISSILLLVPAEFKIIILEKLDPSLDLSTVMKLDYFIRRLAIIKNTGLNYDQIDNISESYLKELKSKGAVAQIDADDADLRRAVRIDYLEKVWLPYVQKEAKINQDVGIGLDLVVRRDSQGMIDKVYQPMINAGQSLTSYLSANEKMKLEDKIDLAIKILEKVEALHNGRATKSGKAIVHEDIKPDNICVNTKGEVTIIDFGTSSIEEGVAEAVCGEKCRGSPMYYPISFEPYGSGEKINEIISKVSKGTGLSVQETTYAFNDKIAALRCIHFPENPKDPIVPGHPAVSIFSRDEFNELIKLNPKLEACLQSHDIKRNQKDNISISDIITELKQCKEMLSLPKENRWFYNAGNTGSWSTSKRYTVNPLLEKNTTPHPGNTLTGQISTNTFSKLWKLLGLPHIDLGLDRAKIALLKANVDRINRKIGIANPSNKICLEGKLGLAEMKLNNALITICDKMISQIEIHSNDEIADPNAKQLMTMVKEYLTQERGKLSQGAKWQSNPTVTWQDIEKLIPKKPTLDSETKIIVDKARALFKHQ